MVLNKLLPLPKVIAHRGASGYAPENTMAAFKKAHELGASWLEFDIQLAKCGEVVLFHDEDLERITQRKGKLSEYLFTDLALLDVGSWFDQQYNNERIPRLGEILEYASLVKMGLNIELKPFPGTELSLVLSLLDHLSRHWDFSQPLLISSFSYEALKFLQREAAHLPLGLLVDNWGDHWLQKLAELGCISLHVNERILTLDKVSEIKALNIKLLAYTVNDTERANELFLYGVDTVFSDFPDKILSIGLEV